MYLPCWGKEQDGSELWEISWLASWRAEGIYVSSIPSWFTMERSCLKMFEQNFENGRDPRHNWVCCALQ